ncbi:MAG: FtsH protease activity modulator HflK [Chromatocurvus sp.]
MAWNEPGGGNNKPKDPWGGGDQGPPDLDEALKKLQQRLGGLFGGRGGGRGGSGGGGKISSTVLGLVAAGVIVVWGLLGFYQVNQQERAVVLRFGEFSKVAQPGLQWHAPLIDEVINVNTTKVRAKNFREMMLTQDENIVEVQASVQYVIDDVESFVLDVRSPETSLEHASKSALRHVVGDMTMDLILTEGRARIATDMQDRLQRYLSSYGTGIRISTVNVDESKPPTQVQGAFDDVIKAREDEERVKSEAQSYANGIVPEARGRAQRQIEEASAYREQVVASATGEASRFNQLLVQYTEAPGVTRERLYIDAVQNVMSKTNKVMVDVEGGNNIMYLPLDKLAERSTASGNQGRNTPIDASRIRELTDAVTQQLRRDAATEQNRRGGVR